MRIALVGQPNVGKSLLFSRMTGRLPIISNYPRTTVEITRATTGAHEYRDTPGLFSLEDDRADAEVTRKIVDESDMILNVVSAPSVDRDLHLTRELAAKGKRMLVALNFSDVAEDRGIQVDRRALENDLGVPVVWTSAKEGTGLAQLRQNLDGAIPNKAFEPRGYATTAGKTINWTERPFQGFMLAVVVMFLLFYTVIKLGNGFANWFEPIYNSAVNEPVIRPAVRSLFGETLFAKMLTGSFGALTMGLSLCVVWVLPFVVLYASLLSLLEDSGFLARMMVSLHWIMRRFGLSGTAITAPVLACGCNVPGVVGSRAYRPCTRTRCVQFIGFAVPCSAQLGAATATLGSSLLPYLVLLILFGFALTALTTALSRKAQPEPEILELPSYEWPALDNFVKKLWARSRYFMLYATPVFLGVCAMASFLYHTGVVHWVTAVLTKPLGLIGIPGNAAMGVVLAVLRKDAGILFLKESNITGPPLLLAAFLGSTVTPCLVTVTAIIRELKWRKAAFIVITQAAFAIAATALVRLVLLRAPTP